MAEAKSAKISAGPPQKRNWAKFFLFVVLPLLLFAGLIKCATLRAGATERAMHEAVRARDLSRVRWLLRIRPSLVNAQDVADDRVVWTSNPSAGPMAGYFRSLHCSVLFSAVENDDADMIALLVTKGADLKAKDSVGSSLLTAAVVNHCPKATEWLLQHGADPNARDVSSIYTTPLMSAAAEDGAACVKLLLAHGADPNIKGVNGMTALSWAVSSGHESVVRILLDAGADPNADTRTLSTARQSNSPDMVELLIARGAK